MDAGESKHTETPKIVWKLLVICPRAGLARELQELLAELEIPAVMQAAYPRPGTIARLAGQHGCNLCILEVASNQELALQLMGEVAPSLAVVALLPEENAELILRCLRGGASEFLSEAGATPLRAILARLARSRAPEQNQRKRGTVYCVVPGKPGCGATTVAIHLALQIHQCGKPKVLLADLDPSSGSIAFMLKLRPEFHLDDVLRDWNRMDDDLWARLTVPVAGVDVLPGPARPGLRIEMARGVAQELLEFWRQRYEAVVIDAGDPRAAIESGCVEPADEILLVATQDVGALHTARRNIELLCRTPGVQEKLRLVLNRYMPGSGMKREDVGTALQLEPFATVGDGLDTIQAAVLRGEPAVANTRFRNSILVLAQQLRGAPPCAKKTSAWLGLLPLRK